MRVVFISGAFRGENSWVIHQHVIEAEKATAKLLGEGFAVICPHTMTQNMQGLYPDRVYLDTCLELVRRSDVIYMLKGWGNSEGALEELNLARELGKDVIYG